MKISVFGLGYVGTVNAVCFAEKGHKVIGVDVKSWKVDNVNRGQSPIKEEELETKLYEVAKRGLLYATTDSEIAVLDSDLSFICVGTPLTKNDAIDLTSIIRVIENIGIALRNKDNYHLIAIRSTVLPGTTEKVIIPLLEKTSNREFGKDFGVCVNPEFLREGSIVEDFMHPELILIGELDKRSGDLLEIIYKDFDARIVRVDIKTAEMTKYAFNAFHALKISFINEIGNICSIHGIDAHTISKILCSDHKLNISPTYLKPGFAFGGSCLPKDLRALIHQSRKAGYTPHLLEGSIRVNETQKEKAVSLARANLGGDVGNKKIAIIGAAFKENTDDVRGSPTVYLIENLVNSQAEIRVYDPRASGNLQRHFGNRIRYSRSIKEAFMDADLVVVSLKYVGGTELHEFLKLMKKKNVLDLVGVNDYMDLKMDASINYVGICW